MFIYILGLFIYIFQCLFSFCSVYLQKFSKIWRILGLEVEISVCLPTLECLFTFFNVYLHSGFVYLHFSMFIYILQCLFTKIFVNFYKLFIKYLPILTFIYLSFYLLTFLQLLYWYYIFLTVFLILKILTTIYFLYHIMIIYNFYQFCIRRIRW